MSSSESTSKPTGFSTPAALRTATARAENPHIGKSGLPFIKITTSLFFTSFSTSGTRGCDMRNLLQALRLVLKFFVLRRGVGFHRQGVHLFGRDFRLE